MKTKTRTAVTTQDSSSNKISAFCSPQFFGEEVRKESIRISNKASRFRDGIRLIPIGHHFLGDVN
jgi:hypothetical protein